MGTGTVPVPAGTTLLRADLRTSYVPAPDHEKRFC